MSRTSVGTGERTGLHEILVVLLSACFVLDAVQFPGTPFPASSICAGFLVVIAYFKRSAGVRRPAWFVLGLIAFVGWLALASAASAGWGGVDVKRLLNVSLWATLAITVASGRLNPRYIGIGLALGVVFAVSWGAATLETSGYEGRLTGVLGDPNTAGLILLVFVCLALPQLRRRGTQITVAAVGLLGIYLTLSRTTWLATACVVTWILVGRRINRWVGLAAVSGLVWWSTTVGDAVLSTSQFSSRAGSDALRARILAAEQVKVDASPLIGQGLGSARIQVDNLTFFFHSSYLALRQEGGWVALVLILSIIFILFIALTALPKDRRSAWPEAALVGVVICAVNLGEVFLTVPTALALGLGAYHLGRHRFRPPRTPGVARPQRSFGAP